MVGLRGKWTHATWYLWYSALLFSFGIVFFGYDAALFGSLQALPSWLDRFGEDIKGKKALSTQTTSIVNSVVWAGKGTGTIVVEPLAKWLGYKKVMFLTCIIQLVGVTVEISADSIAAFAAGRTVTYLAAGIVENIVPAYVSEITPAPLRGFFAGSLVTFLLIGNLLGAALPRAYADSLTDAGWRVPVAIGYLPAVIIMAGIWFTPESPRWLVGKGLKERALTSLERLRPKWEVDNGAAFAEVNALEEAVVEARSVPSGRWIDLFRRSFIRRTMLSMWLFIYAQIGGSQFVGAYGPTFYKQIGRGDRAFTYQTVQYGCSIVAVLIAQILYDRIGRRPILIAGTALQTLFMLLVAGLGTKAHKTTSDTQGVVASLILFYPVSRFGMGNCSYLISAEMGGVDMRKKLLAWGTLWDVLAAFTVTYSSPYLINAPANLGAKVGWIFSGVSASSCFFATFFVPELKGRSLEETDELFGMNLWAWQFSKAQTSGVGARIANLETSGEDATKARSVDTPAVEVGHQGTAERKDLDTIV